MLIKNGYAAFLLVFIGLLCHSHPVRGANRVEPKTLTYYLNVTDFAENFIQIPTTPVSSGVVSSTYLAGKAALYNLNNVKVGTCSASFLCMQTTDQEGIFNDISNYLSTDDGLIVTWFTPSTLINLELDSIIHSMVTECTVTVTTKVGLSPFYGKTYSLVVSSDDEKIYFQFTRIGTIF